MCGEPPLLTPGWRGEITTYLQGYSISHAVASLPSPIGCKQTTGYIVAWLGCQGPAVALDAIPIDSSAEASNKLVPLTLDRRLNPVEIEQFVADLLYPPGR